MRLSFRQASEVNRRSRRLLSLRRPDQLARKAVASRSTQRQLNRPIKGSSPAFPAALPPFPASINRAAVGISAGKVGTPTERLFFSARHHARLAETMLHRACIAAADPLGNATAACPGFPSGKGRPTSLKRTAIAELACAYCVFLHFLTIPRPGCGFGLTRHHTRRDIFARAW